jgi:ABC-2 type transport system permease protein
VKTSLRGLWQLARAGFRRESRYRLAAFAGLFTNVVFGFIKSAVLLAAVQSAGGILNGYTAANIGAYVWISQGLLGAIVLSGMAEIGERIRTGDVAVDFIRPIDVQMSYLAMDLGRATFTLIPRGIPSVLVGMVTIGVVMPGAVLPYVLGALSLVLGVAISFLCRYAVNLLGFWIVETRGVRTLYAVVSGFLCGLYVPVAIFPGWLSVLANATPFPSTIQSPVDVISGRVTGAAALGVLAVQVLWVVVVFLAGRLLTHAGRRKLEIQGG